MKPGNRRILHQPLFPIQWNSPPPPPPSPPLFSTNPLTATATSSPTHHDSSTKTVTIVASISIGLLFLLSLLFLFFQHRAVQNPPIKSKRDEHSEVGSTEKMAQLELYHLSPEIRPLPPLLTGVAVQLSLSHPSPEIKPLAPLAPRQSTENRALSDEHVQLFTPKRSLERSYSWSGTTRFSIGSSPNLSQQQTTPPRTQPVDLNGNVEVDLASNELGIHSSDKAIVWGRFKSRSLRLDDDMIEIITTSFGKERMLRRGGGASLPKRENRVLDPEKAESIEILLRTLNVTTEDVCGALLDGGSEFLGTEFFDSLLKLAPTKEEEFLLRHYKGEVTRLNAGERFLKAMLNVPFPMKRIDVMLYRARFETDIDYLKKSFQTLQDACQDLRRNRLFLKLLETATGTANQINNGNTQENPNFSRLDSLLNLCDAKGKDGRATPLHFTVEDLISNQNIHSDIIREEECKKKGLKAIAGLSAELENVKKAAEMDLDMIRDHVKKEDLGLEKVIWLLQLNKACSVGEKFFERMKEFANEAEIVIENVKQQEDMTLRCLRETAEYFNLEKDEANPLRIFILVRDILLVLEGVCKDLSRMQDRAMIGSRSGRFLQLPPIPSAVT
ncbi:formin-like protein 8-like protein [Carex littledalei]|uniref:Formin-like protein n=1 Tax=Carex littledalei TaxID=544730 RepID=A0A833QFP2_9POAL|nr:formin-like protein 8-like protein [Carex littledalei]